MIIPAQSCKRRAVSERTLLDFGKSCHLPPSVLMAETMANFKPPDAPPAYEISVLFSILVRIPQALSLCPPGQTMAAVEKNIRWTSGCPVISRRQTHRLNSTVVQSEKSNFSLAKLLVTGACFWYVARQIDFSQALPLMPRLIFAGRQRVVSVV